MAMDARAGPPDDRGGVRLLVGAYSVLAGVVLLDLLAVLRAERLAAATTVAVLCAGYAAVRRRSRRRVEIAACAAFAFLLAAAAAARLQPSLVTFALYAPALAFVALALRGGVRRGHQERAKERERKRAAVQAREEERRRWARELHDGPVQTVIGVRTLLVVAQRSGDAALLQRTVGRVVEMLDHEDAALRALVIDLRPPSLGRLGLCDALGELADRTTQVHNLPVNLMCGDLRQPLELSEEAELAVYRVVQEALTNAATHARASAVTVTMATTAQEWLQVTVRDDGCGLPAGPSDRHGLVGMRERAMLVRGELELRSSQKGTVVDLRVPTATAGSVA